MAGFKETVYKNPLEIEFENRRISFSREKQYNIELKGRILRHIYNADFILFDQILLEVKATPIIINPFVAQTINYLKASGPGLGIIAKFGETSFTFKRVVF